jgi:membrane-bound ClpP family serine protease
MVEVMGWAASAASVIAMAGDEIVMGLGTTMMVHNCWALVVGNRHDLAKEVSVLESIDGGMADIYTARTGMDRDDVLELLDAETWLNTSQAVEKGFADRVDDTLTAETAEALASEPVRARRQLDALLASQGVPRSERRRLLREAAGMPGAAVEGMRDAALSERDIAAFRRLIDTLKH